MCGGPPKKDKKNKKRKKASKRLATPVPPSMAEKMPQSSVGDGANKYSSPSRMTTASLTDIFQVPSQRYPTIEQVIRDNGFELGDKLGKGTYAVVYKARRLRDNTAVACKVLEVENKPDNRKSLQMAKNELFIMERVSHPHVIQLHRSFIVDKEDIRHVYIFMQLADRGSLTEYMRTKGKIGLPEETCKSMFAQIVSAVAHMHEKGIAHRDLKLGNVLLDTKGDCLVTDFGLSGVMFRRSKGGTQMATEYRGTKQYMAPEIILARRYAGVEYDPFAADVWALGVLLFALVNQSYPFKDDETMVESQMEGKFKMTKRMQFELDDTLDNIFKSLLEPNVSKRIKAAALLPNPWFAEDMRIVQILERAYQKRKLSN